MRRRPAALPVCALISDWTAAPVTQEFLVVAITLADLLLRLGQDNQAYGSRQIRHDVSKSNLSLCSSAATQLVSVCRLKLQEISTGTGHICHYTSELLVTHTLPVVEKQRQQR
jgi:hypothetical protein